MHPTLISPLLRRARRAWIAFAGLAAGVGGTLGAQVPVVVTTGGGTAVQRADALLRDGHRTAATDLLGQHLAEQPTDGRAWLYLGRIYLADAQRWHREGHQGEPPGPLLLDFAGAAFEQSQQLMTDSGTVHRVLVAVEKATNRTEESGWDAAVALGLPAEEVPLPPVLSELGHNLTASCPRGGVLITGSLVETAAAWGIRLLEGNPGDLILLRPDLYAWDARYRAAMSQALDVDSSATLATALLRASVNRPICLAPSVDSLLAPSLDWRPLHMVLITGPARSREAGTLSVHQLARTGLAGSVWSEAVVDAYDLAARRNPALCRSLFVATDAQGLPTISSCPR
ncbi:MAG: hypothetical protein V4503_08130 [Gemmatimonadota bacterium]